jgi:4-amino-4-deoxy-L-arabinose transferase-like glycosyltransferase
MKTLEPGAGDRSQLLALLFLAVTVLWTHIEREVFHSPDGPFNALIGKELAQRPVTQWPVLTAYGQPFYEHPHLFFWSLGLAFKIFGVGTLPALLPGVTFGTLTVILTYRLGRLLYDHRLGLIGGLALALTPVFVKAARNPMIEVTLMFFVYLSAYLAIGGNLRRDWRWTVAAGLAWGMALLAKGPPALLVFGLLIPFFAYCRSSTEMRKTVDLRPSRIALQLAIVLGVGVFCVGVVDLWHFQATGFSFFERYLTGQVMSSIQDASEQHSHRSSSYYLSILFSRKYLPWLMVAAFGSLLAVKRRDERAIATAVLSWSAIIGTVLGFGVAAKKNEWYLGILLPGLSLAVGVTVRSLISTAGLDRFFVKVCTIPAVILLFLCAVFPSLFEYNREREYFLAEAGAVARERLVGQKVAVCIPLNRWTGPALISFYLGGEFSECNGPARFKISRSRGAPLSGGYVDIYSGHTFSLLERQGGG